MDQNKLHTKRLTNTQGINGVTNMSSVGGTAAAYHQANGASPTTTLEPKGDGSRGFHRQGTYQPVVATASKVINAVAPSLNIAAQVDTAAQGDDPGVEVHSGRNGPLKNFIRPTMINMQAFGGQGTRHQYQDGISGKPQPQQNTQLIRTMTMSPDKRNQSIKKVKTSTEEVQVPTAFDPVSQEQSSPTKVKTQQVVGGPVSKQIARDLRKLQESKAYSQHYEFERVLGEGAFCTVYQAVDKETGEQIAVKVIKRKTLHKEGVELLKQEASLLQSMDHKNIIKFKHFKEIKGKIFLGMELMRGGQLSELILARKREERQFSDEEASQIIKAVFEAVEYLHNSQIVHRDLKPDNILISDPDDLSSIKIADFGLSAKYEQTNDDQVGTLIFMSPELIQKRKYSPGVDVFATGIVLYMLLTGGSHPLYTSHDFSTEKYKQQLLALSQFTFPEHLSPLAANLFHRLTKFNSKMRYSASDALRHPWITRLNKTLIPMTLQDKIENMQTEHSFRAKIGMMLFLSNVSHSENYFENPAFNNYKKLLHKVSNKIEKWYLKRQDESDYMNERFSRDEDYVELAESPSKFESSTDEEEAQSDQEGLQRVDEQSQGSGATGEGSNHYDPSNFFFGQSPKRNRELTQVVYHGDPTSEAHMRLLATSKQRSEDASLARMRSLGSPGKKHVKDKASREQQSILDLTLRQTGTHITNVEEAIRPLKESGLKERSPGLRGKATHGGVGGHSDKLNQTSPRKRQHKKKTIQLQPQHSDVTRAGAQSAQVDLTQNSIRNNYNGNLSYTGNGPVNVVSGISQPAGVSASVEKSFITQSVKSGAISKGAGQQRVIKREDIIMSSHAKKNTASPRAAIDMDGPNISQNQITGDYDYYKVAPYQNANQGGLLHPASSIAKKAALKGVVKGKGHANDSLSDAKQKEQTITQSECVQNHSHAKAGKVSVMHSTSNKTQGGKVDVTRNESFERLYSSFNKEKSDGADSSRFKSSQSSPRKSPTAKKRIRGSKGASLWSQQFVDEDNIGLKDIEDEEYQSTIHSKLLSDVQQRAFAKQPLAIGLKAMRRASVINPGKSHNHTTFLSSERTNKQKEPQSNNRVTEAVAHLQKDSARREAGQVALEIKQEFQKREQMQLQSKEDWKRMALRNSGGGAETTGEGVIMTGAGGVNQGRLDKHKMAVEMTPKVQANGNRVREFSTEKIKEHKSDNFLTLGVDPGNNKFVQRDSNMMQSEEVFASASSHSGYDERDLSCDYNNAANVAHQSSVCGNGEARTGGRGGQKAKRSSKRKGDKKKDKKNGLAGLAAGTNLAGGSPDKRVDVSMFGNNSVLGGQPNGKVQDDKPLGGSGHYNRSNTHHSSDHTSSIVKQRSLIRPNHINAKESSGNFRPSQITQNQLNNSQTHGGVNRVEIERKRNAGYDQKFLFKKNFISKYQPNSTAPLNHPNYHQQQIHAPKQNTNQGHGKKGQGPFGGGANDTRRYDSNNIGQIKIKASKNKAAAQASFVDSNETTPAKFNSQPASFRPIIQGHNLQGSQLPNSRQSHHAQQQKQNDLPRIEQASTWGGESDKESIPMRKNGGSRHLKSGSTEGTGQKKAPSTKGSKQQIEDKELTAVRHRIGTILSSNHILDESTSKEQFFKKETTSNHQTQTNPFMLATESGLAPPPYAAPKNRQHEDGLIATTAQLVSRKMSFNESSETNSRNTTKVDLFEASKRGASNTHKVSKKRKAEDPGQFFMTPSGAPSQKIAGNQGSQLRRKSQKNLYSGSKIAVSDQTPTKNDLVPSHLEHRQSQPLSQSTAFGFSAPTGQKQQQQSTPSQQTSGPPQQRTQSNPTNRVTAFIKIQHMPAELLLKQQKPIPSSNQHSVVVAPQNYHMNAMLAQQQRHSTEPSQGLHHLAEFTAQSAAQTAKLSPYGNSQIKSWGRPVKSQYVHNQCSGQQNLEQTQDIGNSRNNVGASSHTRQMSIARNVQQMGHSSGLPFTRKANQRQQHNQRGSHSVETYLGQQQTGAPLTMHGCHRSPQVAAQGGAKGGSGAAKTPFVQYEPTNQSPLLEQGLVGITGISIYDKSMSMKAACGYQNNPASQTFAGERFMRSGAGGNQQPMSTVPVSSQQSTYVLHHPQTALDLELLQNQDCVTYKSSKNTSSGPAAHNHAQGKIQQQMQQLQDCNSQQQDYQVAQQVQMAYGRQNSDQTAYMRNMRSVLHHNGLQQKNNFISFGNQQLTTANNQAAAATTLGLSQNQQLPVHPAHGGVVIAHNLGGSPATNSPK